VSLDVDVMTRGTRLPVSRARMCAAAARVLRSERIRDALVSITFLSTREIARLNATHLRHAGPTDVISFGFNRATASDPVVGDIYICAAVAKENARSRKSPIREELIRLVVHGALHVLGHDHPDDDRERSPMWRRQERFVRRVMLRGRS
jgi:probable rRNA maturation factor